MPEIEFSDSPGAHERHLIRRHNNPLFRPERRTVTLKELLEARALDQKENEDLFVMLRMILSTLDSQKKCSQVSGQPISFDYLNEKRQEIDALYDQVAATDVKGYELRFAVRTLRKEVIALMRAVSDPEKLDKAEALVAERDVAMDSDCVRQILRKQHNSIPPDEVVPALLTEDLDSLKHIMRWMPKGAVKDTQIGVITVVKQALDEGHNLPGIQDKLAALGLNV